MKFQNLLYVLLVLPLLMGCSGTTVYTGPSIEINKVAKVYVNVNSKQEIVIGGDVTILSKTIKNLGSVNWETGFEYTFNEAKSESRKLYILREDNSGNIQREEYSFAQPFEVEFAKDEWVKRITQTGDHNVIVFVDIVSRRPIEVDTSNQARISSEVEEVNMRRSLGYLDKDDSYDVIVKIPSSAIVEIIRGPETADDLDWWYVSLEWLRRLGCRSYRKWA